MMRDEIYSSKTTSFELVFKNLAVKIGKRDILSDVSGLAKPGEVMAIMGPSGKEWIT